MSRQCISAALNWLDRHTDWPPRPKAALANLGPLLLADLPENRPCAIGISGPPGSGKSTLAGMLRAVLQAVRVPSTTLSLDDYYLPQRDRRRLADSVHTLFSQRGVPGTHDLRLFINHVDRLLAGDVRGLDLPRFDKTADDRRPRPEPYRGRPPQCLLLEGWCLGAPPFDGSTLAAPFNALELAQDTQGIWRRAVASHLQEYHRQIASRLDLCWYLCPPHWDSVIDWRWQQEQDVGVQGAVMAGPRSKREVRDFLATFERLCAHMQNTCRAWADRVIVLGTDHRPRA